MPACFGRRGRCARSRSRSRSGARPRSTPSGRSPRSWSPVQLGPGAQPGEVAAGVGLAHAQAPADLGPQRGQGVTRLLLLGAPVEDGRGDDRQSLGVADCGGRRGGRAPRSRPSAAPGWRCGRRIRAASPVPASRCRRACAARRRPTPGCAPRTAPARSVRRREGGSPPSRPATRGGTPRSARRSAGARGDRSCLTFVSAKGGAVGRRAEFRPAAGAGATRARVVRSMQPAMGPPPAATAATSGVTGTWRCPPSPRSWTHASCSIPNPCSRPAESCPPAGVEGDGPVEGDALAALDEGPALALGAQNRAPRATPWSGC